MQEPRIAVLIPAYNEELVIAGTIKALIHADAERSDIYVVDDKSTDKTAEIARSMVDNTSQNAAGGNPMVIPRINVDGKCSASQVKGMIQSGKITTC